MLTEGILMAIRLHGPQRSIEVIEQSRKQYYLIWKKLVFSNNHYLQPTMFILQVFLEKIKLDKIV